MTEQEKDLLIKDYCARVPYGLKLNFYARAINKNVLCTLLGIEPESDKPIIATTDNGSFIFTQDHVKPYLRRISSLTDEEKSEYANFWSYDEYDEAILTPEDAVRCGDWLDAHLFDYRGLIEKGLAIEAPEGIYEVKGGSVCPS